MNIAETIPEHIWEEARSLRGAVLWESNSAVHHIAIALEAAERRGEMRERERAAGGNETRKEHGEGGGKAQTGG